MARDPYQELGVSRTASADEVRKAFRKLAKENHPDTNPGNKAAEEKFKRVSAAFDILGDPDKRRKYDAGQIDGNGREAGGWVKRLKTEGEGALAQAPVDLAADAAVVKSALAALVAAQEDK